jgi:hypothetical protein
MSLEREVLADQSEARQESLCAIRIKEATHAPEEVPLGDPAFAFKRRLMASFGGVVHPPLALTRTCLTFISSEISAFAAG